MISNNSTILLKTTRRKTKLMLNVQIMKQKPCMIFCGFRELVECDLYHKIELF